ncbi:MAG: hypothetical protein KC777_02435 [Cyanobacteria bacterium HKST-UBA02]|nr:hypothetical protein [Cyanobacteria bacterium HKST-UBA02]
MSEIKMLEPPTWEALRKILKEHEATYDSLTRHWTLEKRSCTWGPVEAFANQAGLQKLRGDDHGARLSFAYALEHAARIVSRMA